MEFQMNKANECKYCNNFWLYYPKKRPYQLAANLSEQTTLYQCKDCSAYWEESLRTARIISEKEARQNFGNYFQRRS